ncbi:hypothetical protein ACWGOK_41075 [Streptomyces eurythermus]
MSEMETATNVPTGEPVVTEVPTADEAYVAALRRERAAYMTYGRPDRVDAVDAELNRLGAEVPGGSETAVESKPRRTAGRGKS